RAPAQRLRRRHARQADGRLRNARDHRPHHRRSDRAPLRRHEPDHRRPAAEHGALMPGGERTEQATPKRRQEARERGQVLKSIEVNTAAILVASAACLQWSLPSMSHSMMELTQHPFEPAAVSDFSTAGLHVKVIGLILFTLKLIAPVLGGLVVAAVVANVL